MNALLNRLLALPQKRKRAVAFLCGAISVLALPPFYFFPALVVAFSLFVLMLSGETEKRNRFWLGFCFGFGHFMLGLQWFCNALMTDPARFGLLMIPALTVIPAFLACYVALPALFTKQNAPGRTALAFALAWTVFEVLRGTLVSNFPWNLIGYVWMGSDAAAQAASIFGAYGMGFLAVLICASPAVWLKAKADGEAMNGAQKAFVVLPWLVVACMWGGGAYRLSHKQVADDKTPKLMLRLVQADIPVSLDWEFERRMGELLQYFEMTTQHTNGALPADRMIIWPEAALQFDVEQEPRVRQALANVIPPGNVLVTGTTRTEGGGETDKEFKIWNSMFMFDHEGRRIAYYDKVQLVPYGEYIPFRTLLPFVQKITRGAVDFSRGEGVKTISVQGFPSFSPLICYEVIYPSQVARRMPDRPHWILNVTNDGWFGKSLGPYQHYAMARMRSIEEGLPLVRAANTGISTVTDAYGTPQASLGLGEKGVIDTALPPAIEPTIFVQYGHKTLLLLMVIIMALLRKNGLKI